MARSWSERWVAIKQRWAIFIRNILFVLGEAETSIQREELLKQISDAKRTVDS